MGLRTNLAQIILNFSQKDIFTEFNSQALYNLVLEGILEHPDGVYAKLATLTERAQEIELSLTDDIGNDIHLFINEIGQYVPWRN